MLSRLAGLLLLTSAATAQPFPDRAGDADYVLLERVSDGEALLTYYNSRSSEDMQIMRYAGDLAVRVGIDANPFGSNEEEIAVIPDPGWIALPSLAYVTDGDTVEIRICRQFDGCGWQGM